MRLFRNPQLWLDLAKEIWERNRGQNLQQVAASLAFRPCAGWGRRVGRMGTVVEENLNEYVGGNEFENRYARIKAVAGEGGRGFERIR